MYVRLTWISFSDVMFVLGYLGFKILNIRFDLG